jgi:hypothetical protein
MLRLGSLFICYARYSDKLRLGVTDCTYDIALTGFSKTPETYPDRLRA